MQTVTAQQPSAYDPFDMNSGMTQGSQGGENHQYQQQFDSSVAPSMDEQQNQQEQEAQVVHMEEPEQPSPIYEQ